MLYATLIAYSCYWNNETSVENFLVPPTPADDGVSYVANDDRLVNSIILS